jgi:hypothetical protein
MLEENNNPDINCLLSVALLKGLSKFTFEEKLL